jgi:YVTN family beta-propeller protein
VSRRRAIAAGVVIVLAAVAVVVVVLADSGTSASSEPVAVSVVRRPGTNLIANASAAVGAVSAQGWDSVTIPGWRVLSGLPTVVRYGTRGFPGGAGRAPDAQRHPSDLRLFAGGAGGTARLAQLIALRSPDGQPPAAGTGYSLSGALAGSATSRASLTLALLARSGRVLAGRTIGPVGSTRLTERVATGTLPPGSAAAKLTLSLATSLSDVDGSRAPLVGYDRAVASSLRFSVSGAVRTTPLRPPVARVPRYDHVFVFYFENEDFGAVIGNTKQAPFLNSLLPHSSLLASFFAEEHPSDGNYLALAAGGTFGIPLDDPLEENPLYTIHTPDIGQSIDAAHETWADYLQSAAGPCDDTVHGYYRNDDLPQLYFADVRERPDYCAAHVLPLERLRADLTITNTTPSFAWIGADDCSDMEGCGISAGDSFLSRELGAIMRSPAWRTQRSLAIITFDEDGVDNEHPAQRVATIMLASSGVRKGYVSHVRYTHYSLLRTIEAALGLAPLTANDRWARPVNDVFSPGTSNSWIPPAPAPAHSAPASTTTTPAAPAGAANAARRRGAPRPAAAFVVSSASGSVTPIDLGNGRAAAAIEVGSDPQAIAITPDGVTALVVNSGSDSVTPIDTITRRAGPPIPVGSDPRAIAITPDGRTAFVVNSGSDSVTPIDTRTLTPERPITVGLDPRAIAITPRGRTAYVLNWGGASLTAINTRSGSVSPPIPVGAYPVAIAFAKDGATAYVADFGSDTVTPIALATGRPGSAVPAGRAPEAIAVGGAPDALAVSPDGRTLEVLDGDTDQVTPIDTATRRAGTPIRVGYSPAAVSFSPAGVAYVVNTISGTVTPVRPGRARAGRPISVGSSSYPLAIALLPGARTAVVLDTYAGQATVIDLRTGHASAPVGTGANPVAVAIGG